MGKLDTRPPVITERDLETLNELEAANADHERRGFRKGWARPMDCGGSNGSHHHKTLQKLVRMGFAEENRGPVEAVNSRPGIMYRINANGAARLAHWRLKRKEASHAHAAE